MKNEKNCKMIVTDLDGTLLKKDKTISEYTIETIRKLRAKGHKFVIATARPFRAAKEYAEVLEADAGIYHNGALLYEGDHKIDSFQIEHAKETIDKILNAYPDAAIAVETNDVLYANFDSESIWPGVGYILTENNFSEMEGKKADKIIVKSSSLSDMKKYEGLLSNDLYMQLSENTIGMIMKKVATKSNGVQFLAQKFSIAAENIIAFGDDYNDIDMLTFCGTGVCVENGITEVKDIADDICGTNESSGVARWIERNLLS